MSNSEIRWKPMTGGRFIPSELPCITSEELDWPDALWPARRYKRLDGHGFVVERWISDYPPQSRLRGLPVITIESLPS
jgi:hypothetical protein